MAVKFFGQYLVENGIVTREALLEAIDLQERTNLRLGETAVSLGFATATDIERAHIAQLSLDMRLGDLLVEMGVLTPGQLEEVITRQKNSHLYIGEALVRTGALAQDQLQQHLARFDAEQDQESPLTMEVPPGMSGGQILQTAVDITCKMITRMLKLPFHPDSCRSIASVDSNFMMAALDLSGDVDARYIISVSRSLQQSVARAVLHETSVEDEPAGVLDDTVMEFANVVCGNLAARMSREGTIVDLNPPVTIRQPEEGLPVPPDYTGVCFPIRIGDGDTMDLVIFIRK